MEKELEKFEGEILDNNDEISQSLILKSQQINDDEIERLDFNNPSSMLILGQKLLNEASMLVTNESIMNQNMDDLSFIKIKERLNSIGDIENKIKTKEDKSDKQTKKAKKNFFPLANLIFKKINDVFSEEELEYSKIYEEYREDIIDIVNYLNDQNKTIIASINQSNEYIKKLEIICQKLIRTVELGREDIIRYQENVVKPLEEQTKVAQDQVSISKLSYANQMISIFTRRLNSLEESALTLYANINQQRQKQGPNMELVTLATDWISTCAPVLINSGYNIIDTHQQSRRLDLYNGIVAKSNEILRENSKNIVDNIQKTIDLKLEGNISIETLRDFAANLNKGTELLNDGIKLMEEQSKKNKDEQKKIKASLDSSREKIEKFYNDNMIHVVGFVETTGQSQLPTDYYNSKTSTHSDNKRYSKTKSTFSGFHKGKK